MYQLGNVLLLFIILFPIACFVKQSISESSHANTLIRFFQYGDDLKKRSFFATLAASNSGLSAAIYLIIVYGYFFGIGIFPWVMLFWILTQFASHFTIKKVEELTKSQGGFISKHGTFHEFLGLLFNSQAVRVAAASLSTLCYIGLITCEILLGYEIVKALLPESGSFLGTRLENLSFIVTIVCVGLVFIYTSLAGFRAVIKTDLLQLSLILIMIVSVWVIISFSAESFVSGYADYYPINLTDALLNPSGQGIGSFLFFFVFMSLIFWAVWWPLAMDQWHRCAATQSASTALDSKFGTLGVYSTLYFAVLSLTFLTVGAFIKVLVAPTGAESAALYHFISYVKDLPGAGVVVSSLFTGLICAGLISAVISTIDSYLVVTAQSIISDIGIAIKERKILIEADKSNAVRVKYLKLARILIVVLFAVHLTSVIAVSQLTDVFCAIYTSFSLMMAAVPILLLGLTGKAIREKASAVVVALITGGLWALITNSLIIYKLEYFSRSGSFEELTFYYNFLYANPIFTAIVSGVMYLFVNSCSDICLFRTKEVYQG